jgi:penicillin G amidase
MVELWRLPWDFVNRLRNWRWLFVFVVWMIFLYRGVSPLPALGPLLDLGRGFWMHRVFEFRDQGLRGLEKPVTVAFDVYGVPHIFAESEKDLYLAQGFVTASQRLFQMDLTSRASVGGLSEIAGGCAKMSG